MKSALMFAILLNFKHIYLYSAPCFGLYYLKKIFLSKKGGGIKQFFIVGLQTILVFSLSLGPFVMMGQLQQLFKRMFAFNRGLTHYYWAGKGFGIDEVRQLVGTVHVHEEVRCKLGQEDHNWGEGRVLVRGGGHFDLQVNIAGTHLDLLTGKISVHSLASYQFNG